MMNKRTIRPAYGKKKKKRRRTRWNYPRIAIAAILAIVVAVLVFLLVRTLVRAFTADKTSTVSETETTPPIVLSNTVMVDDISITGMTIAEAREAILKNYNWNVKARLEGETEDTYAVKNLIEPKVDELLTTVYSGKPSESYTLDFAGIEEEIIKEVVVMEEKWNIAPKNGAISGFDKDTNNFTYAGEENGRKIDDQKLMQDIQKIVNEKNFNAVIDVKSEIVPPEISKEQAKEMYKVIGTCTTNTTKNKDRNTNISLACAAMDGLIIQAGEQFSFNNVTGNRTLAKGYKPAGAYLNGELVEEPGGGVCQVSSTLYNAVVFAGLTPTERHAHSYEPSYVTPGEDAMVSYDGYAGPDMKFSNTSSSAIAIRAKLVDQKLTISIVGIPILEKGVKISMSSKKEGEYDVAEPLYEEDPTLEPGVEVELRAGTRGSRWSTNLIKQKDGVVISEEFFHNSTYKGKQPIIKRNTSGVVESVDEESLSDLNEEDMETLIDESVDLNESDERGVAPGDTTKAKETTKAKNNDRQGPGETTKTKTSTKAKETTKAKVKETTKAKETAASSNSSNQGEEPSSAAENTAAEITASTTEASTIPPKP